MSKRTIMILGFVALIAVAAFGWSVLRKPEGASGEIAVIAIEDTPTQMAAIAAEDTPAEPATEDTSAITFTIDPAQSEASFTIGEILRGSPFVVVGTTDQVGGEIRIDFDTPANSQVGTIQVNARTLTTDSEFRNRALKNRILLTSGFEFITFEPTAINGLPDTITLGEAVSFEIVGNLLILNATEEVTFTAEVTVVSENEITGSAETSIQYRDYNVLIPQVPAVASVDEDVQLFITFTALAP